MQLVAASLGSSELSELVPFLVTSRSSCQAIDSLQQVVQPSYMYLESFTTGALAVSSSAVVVASSLAMVMGLSLSSFEPFPIPFLYHFVHQSFFSYCQNRQQTMLQLSRSLLVFSFS